MQYQYILLHAVTDRVFNRRIIKKMIIYKNQAKS